MSHGSTPLPSPARRRLLGSALALTAGAAVCSTSRAAIGTGPAPDFTLRSTAGSNVRLQEQRGQVVMVNFWATWCDTCVAEMPALEQLVLAEKDRPFTLLAVSVDESWEAVRRFFAGGTQLTVLLDPDKGTPPRYGTEKFPETFIIDREGNIRYYVVSSRDWAAPEVRACLELLMRS